MKINPNKPAERLRGSATIQIATKSPVKLSFTNADLPSACLPLWNERYVPLIWDWAGTLGNPWKYHNVDVSGNLQRMWDIVYPDIIIDILPKEPIFVRVCTDIFQSREVISNVAMFQSIQRITEWRGAFGSGAIAALKVIWCAKGINTQEGRRKYASHMLGKGLPFTWGCFNSIQGVRHLPCFVRSCLG